MKFNLALLQINSYDEVEANLTKVETLIREASQRGAQLAALPEYAARDGSATEIASAADRIPGRLTDFYSRLAAENGIWIHCGSITEIIEGSDRFYNTSLVFAPTGELVARYRKIHLFDVGFGGEHPALESKFTMPGDFVTVFDTPFGRMGLSICFDLRFPELYRAMAVMGAEMLFAPASFRMFTGKDHWEVLIRARAIENQCFVIAPAQIGPHGKFSVYGRSMAADPWGNVILTAPDREGVYITEIDTSLVSEVRASLPSLANRSESLFSFAALGDIRPHRPQ